MANASAIASLGASLEQLLGDAFADPGQPAPVPGRTTTAVLSRAEDFDITTGSRIARPCLSILLYRVSVSGTQRAVPLHARTSALAAPDAPALPLELHYLLTPWAESAESEHAILGRALQCLHSTPVMSGAMLQPGGGWSSNDRVELVIEDASPDLHAGAAHGVFSALPVHFKLGVLCRARVIQIDAQSAQEYSDTTR